MPSTNAIMGLTLSTNGSSLNVSTGWARDGADTDDIVSNSSLAVNPATSGIGGLDTGSVAASTVYTAWLLKKSDGTVGAMISAASAGASVTLPAGWSGAKMRRIGCCSTNSSGALIPFFQTGKNNDRTYSWTTDLSTRKVLSAGTAASWTAVAATELTPESAKIIIVQIVPDDATFEARSIGAGIELQGSTPTIYGLHATNDVDILEYRKTAGAGSIDGYVMGFVESL